MIHSVSFKNFQSLRSVELNLGQVTVIVGHSDAGKSAIVRALQYAVFNISGNTFLTSVNGKQSSVCEVTFVTDDGSLTWQRSSSIKYLLFLNTGLLELTKLGRGTVPKEVQDFLGIREIQIDEKTTQRIQFLGQHDTPFLVVDRGGVAAARVLGTLTGLHVFSNASKMAETEKRSLTKQLAIVGDRVYGLRESIKVYDGVEDRYSNLVKLKESHGQIVESTRVLLRLKDLKLRYDRWKSVYASISNAPVLGLRDFIEKLTGRLKDLWGKLSRLYFLKKIYFVWKRVSESDSDLNYSREDLQNLQEEMKSLHDSILKLREMSLLLEVVGIKLNDVNDLTIEMDETKSKIRNLQEEMKQFPLCPWQNKFSEVSADAAYRCEFLFKKRSK